MEMNKAILFIAFVWLATASAKTYKKCDLAKELVTKHKFGRTMLSTWMCMIEAESEFDTTKVMPYPLTAGTFNPIYQSFGLFQINNKSYCGKGYTGGKCKVRCEDLLKDDITKAVQCAQIVQSTEGFKAWKGWETKCKPNINKLPPLTECFKTAAIAG